MEKLFVVLLSLALALVPVAAQAVGFKYQHLFTASGTEIAVQISSVTGQLRKVHFGQGSGANSFVKIFDRNSGCAAGLALTDSTAIAGPVGDSDYELQFTTGLCVLESGGSITVTYSN
jgi:hypothetical protein